MSASTGRQPIVLTDRVSDVLARDESLVELFVRLAPPFARLRSRTVRRIMARLVTVEQAARMADLRPEALLRDLNEALGMASREEASMPLTPSIDGMSTGEDQRARSVDVHPSHGTVVELDVRDDLRAGREPFSRIVTALSALTEGDVVHLRTIFEPVPLYAVLEKRGCRYEAQAHTDDHWSVWFWRPAGDDARAAAASPPMADAGVPEPAAGLHMTAAPNVVELDVRGLEPPEPLLRTLAALEALPTGYTLVQVNARVPHFLLPLLAERGFTCAIDESHANRVLVRIWRPHERRGGHAGALRSISHR